MVYKKKIFVFLSLFTIFFASCSRPSSPKPIEEPYIVFIKKTLPSISKGSSKEEVEEILQIPRRFNGIVLSNGSDDAFSYNYYINDFCLTLVFNYKYKKGGSFANYALERSREIIN